jgi:hypothetical protein
MFQFQTWEIEFDTAGESFEAAMGAISRLVDVLGKDGFRVDQLARVRGDIVDAFSPLAEEPESLMFHLRTVPCSPTVWKKFQGELIGPLLRSGVSVRDLRKAA